MDDLSGLTWSSTTPNKSAKPTSNLNSLNLSSTQSSYSSFRSTPSPLASGRNTPLSAANPIAALKPTNTPSGPSSASSKPSGAQDSFANLMNLAKVPSATTSTANLSLRERQELLEAEKRRKEEEKRKLVASQFNFDQMVAARSGPGSSSTLSNPVSAAGSGSGSVGSFSSPFATPLVPKSSTPIPKSGTPASKASSNDDDLFAAFRADTKVDNASHYPPPAGTPVPQNTRLDLSNPTNWSATTHATGELLASNDDDPFGLTEFFKGRSPPPAPLATDADDLDFLGDLARPVEEVRREQEAKRHAEEALQRQTEEAERRRREKAAAQSRPPPRRWADSDNEAPAPTRAGPTGNQAFDKAVEQLMAYGFAEEDAQRGLTESSAGINVQAAANWLLDDAHRKAKEKALGKSGQRRSESSQTRPHHQPERSGSHSGEGSPAWMAGAGGEDIQKTVAAVGGQLFKTANSLWKTGQKKVQKAMADFNQDGATGGGGGGGGDPSQPKWMRDAQMHSERKATGPQVTDEAMILEGGGRHVTSKTSTSSRQHASQQPSRTDSRSITGRLAKEDDDLGGYVSPNKRRGRPQQSPIDQPKQSSPIEGDLLGGSSVPMPRHKQQTLPQRPAQKPQASPSPTRRPSPKPVPRRPARQIPAISPIALQTSTRHRLQGTAHFKRGDYASAHSSYSSSLQALPQTHPLAIILLTNRALTSLKNGEPKNAITDADSALQLIGPGRGQDESVMVVTEAGAEEKRDMKELYGKALSRKAEALEHLERWADAGAVWQQCVEAGIGGAIAIAGRQRCQKALAPKAAPRPTAKAPVRPKPRPAVSLNGGNGNSEAVERLRKANEAAVREDDEKFALSEKVDAKIAAWRDGKRENLRALIGTMDAVLWENSGWNKVGLHELVMANKAKIAYMKAIAKTHPDKIPQDASTEVRLIAATVFATLNEAWDKFKAENNM